MSPTMATRHPSSDGPRWRRSVNASSSAWVGCSWRPSPPLITDSVDPLRDPVRRAGGTVAHDHRVDVHRFDGLDRVEEALALLHRRRPDHERHRVRREPLGRGLEREPGAGRLLVEERDHRLAPQRRDLRDLAGEHVEERVRLVEHLLDAGPVEVLDGEQVLHSLDPPSRPVPTARSRPRSRRRSRESRTRTSSADAGRAGSCRRSPRGSAARGGRGPRAPRAGSPAGRPSSVTASSAARIGAAGEEHVVDQHHDPAGHVDRHLGRTERLHRPQADVVAVEGDVERARPGTVGLLERRDRRRRAGARSPGRGCGAR